MLLAKEKLKSLQQWWGVHSGVLEWEEGNSMVRDGYRLSQWYHDALQLTVVN